MRIGLISTSRVPSRTANSIELMKVCQALKDLGHTINLWLPDRDPETDWEDLLPRYGIHSQIPITRIPMSSLLHGYDFSVRAVFAARRWNSDLLYVWPYQAAAAASILGLPTVLELHDEPPAPHGHRLLRAFLKGKGAARVLPTTEALKKRAEELAGFTFEEGFAILSPNGVDLNKYSHFPAPEIVRGRIGWKEEFTVGYTGQLYDGRGLSLLLELANMNPDVQFVWAGGEPDTKAEWQNRIDEAGVDNTILLGFVPNADLPEIQAACDVLVMPYERKIAVSSGGDTSRYASPMKAFEYLAAGRVILSSDLPVVREVLNERNAVLLPPEDIDAWDKALNRIRADVEQQQVLAHQAKQDSQQYSWLEREKRALAGLELTRQNDGKSI